MEAIFLNIEWDRSKLQDQLNDFKKLSVSKSLMSNGLLFVWAEKDVIMDVLNHFEAQDFKYVENIVVIQMSVDKIGKHHFQEKENLGKRPSLLNFFGQAQKKLVTDSKVTIDQLDGKLPTISDAEVTQCFHTTPREFIGCCKKTLLMLRRSQDGHNLELRHQRSFDCYFDMFCEGSKNGIDRKGMEHLYKIIETLLPKAQSNPELPKLCEIFGQKDTARPGWITFYECSKINKSSVDCT